MSWAEVFKINSNFKKPINEQIRELKYSGAYLITTSRSFVAEKSGYYKVIVVSRGGNGDKIRNTGEMKGGSSGAVAISTLHLKSGTSYPIIVNNANSSKDYTSFNGEIICYNAVNSTYSTAGTPGTAIGGNFNYDGSVASGGTGASVGAYIPELMQSSMSIGYNSSGNAAVIYSGSGILGYGGGQTVSITYNAATSVKGGCVLIIPLEFEE